MTWSAPMTATTGVVFTAAQFNQFVRDNLNMTAPAVATTAARLIVTLGANQVGERGLDLGYVGSFETTTATTYGSLTTPGPSVVLTTSTKALIMIGSQGANSIAGLGSRIGYAVSGASSVASADAQSWYAESGNLDDGFQGTWTTLTTGLTAGSNTFTLEYRTTAGGGTSEFGHRLLGVIPF